MAKEDAENGDLSATAWLITEGTDIAERISPGISETILRFCREMISFEEARYVRRKWGLELKQESEAQALSNQSVSEVQTNEQ